MSDESADGHEPAVGARGLTLCKRVSYDGSEPDAPYTLHGVLTTIRVRAVLPALLRQPVSVYVEFFGEPGEYQIWLDLARVWAADTADDTETAETEYGPFVLNLAPDLFAQSRSYYLPRVPFSAAGVYELRLYVAGGRTPLTTYRFKVEEVI